MVKTLTATFLVLALIAGSVAGLSVANVSAQTSGLDVTLHSTDHEVDPGQKFGLTAEITNDYDVTQHDVIVKMRVTQNSSEVDYVSGSGEAKLSTSSTVHDLSNSWVDNGQTLGDIPAGASATLTWQMEVEDNADEGEWIQIAFEVWSDELSGSILAYKNIYIGERDEQDKHFTLSKRVNKDVANPGDILRYTIEVENDGDGVLDDILIVEDLPNGDNKWVTYVRDSGEYEIDGEEEELDDDWIEDGFELEYLNEDQTLTITFEAKVRSDAPHGLILNNIVNVKPKGYDEWAQAAANTTVHVPGAPTPQPPVKKPELPKTGVGGIFVAVWSLAASGLGSGAFYAGRKFILG